MTNQTPAIVMKSTSLVETREQLPTLNQSLHLEEGKPPQQSRLTIFIIVLFLGLFIFWAAITPVDEVAEASGKIIPTGFVKSIQHLEGGIMSELLVHDGEEVKAGQVLVRLDGKAARSELDQMQIRDVALQIKAERLRAVGLDQHPNFDSFDPKFKNLVDDQKAIYDMQMRNRTDQIAIIDNQIEQQKALLILQLGQERDTQEQLEIVKHERDVNKILFDKRLKTGTDYRRSEENYAKTRKDLDTVMNQTQQTRQQISEAENKLLEVRTHLRNDALTELGKVTEEIAEVDQTIKKLQDRVNRLDVIAPTSGVVQGIKLTTLNGVIQPGEEIMEIVPKAKPEVEAQVEPKDIGNVKPGQTVLVKVSAYDYARFGGINGKLKSLSATTFQDVKINDNKPFYKAYITLDKLYVGNNPKINPVSPGMTVKADIYTGVRTLLFYLIKPVYNAVSTSFQER